MPLPLLPTSLVGSYAQPDWLIDRKKLAGRFPPRVRAKELWRVRAGISRRRRRTTRRCSRSATRSAPASTSSPTARCGARAIPTASPPRSKASTSTIPAPRSTAPAIPIRCRASPASPPQAPGRSRDVKFLRANTDRTIKITVPGPFTMSQQAQNDFYKDEEEMALDYAAAVNAEIKDLFAAGADIVQIDEPYMQARPDKARQVRLEGAQPRARRRQGHDRGAHLLRLCRRHPRAAGGLFVPAGVRRHRRCSRSRSRPRSPASTARCWKSCRARPSSSACSISPT